MEPSSSNFDTLMDASQETRVGHSIDETIAATTQPKASLTNNEEEAEKQSASTAVMETTMYLPKPSFALRLYMSVILVFFAVFVLLGAFIARETMQFTVSMSDDPRFNPDQKRAAEHLAEYELRDDVLFAAALKVDPDMAGYHYFDRFRLYAREKNTIKAHDAWNLAVQYGCTWQSIADKVDYVDVLMEERYYNEAEKVLLDALARIDENDPSYQKVVTRLGRLQMRALHHPSSE